MTIRIEPAPQKQVEIKDTKRIASAPYNFVPLPEVVVTAVSSPNDLPPHNTYADGKYKHTGYFDVTLTTRSPLYVRAALTLEQFAKQERGDEPKDDFRALAKNTPDFFYTRAKQVPVIPGSSLRGMLRALLEIVSHGKMMRVTDKHKIYFRAVAAPQHDPLSTPYKDILGKFGANVRVGYLHKDGDVWKIRPAKSPQDIGWSGERKPYLSLKDSFFEHHPLDGFIRFNEDNFRPQYLPISFDFERRQGTDKQGKKVSYTTITAISPDTKKLSHRGVLVASGNMRETGDETPSPRNKYAIVLEENSKGMLLNLNAQAVLDYEDSLTPFQAQNPPFDAQHGSLALGQVIFYVPNGKEVIHFGHTPNFRISAYAAREKRAITPNDLVPDELKCPEYIDFAEAMLGYVRTFSELEDMVRRKVIKEIAPQGDPQRAFASRISVTQATLVNENLSDDEFWLVPPTSDPIVPKILATPKPTAFQMYLTQQEPDLKSKLDHYTSPPPHATNIRGNKLYWHQGKRTFDDLKEKDEQWLRDGKVKPESTQHTQFRPVRDGVEFKFRVYFENLSDEELGALCWALHPVGEEGKTYCHSLGMGKPFGMGAVKLEATLHLTERVARYSTLFAENDWVTGEKDGELNAYRARFEEFMLQELQPNRPLAHLSEMPRIAMLLKMIEFPGFAAGDLIPGTMYLQEEKRPNTRYMTIRFDPQIFPNLSAAERNEFRERPVLPDVTAFMSEPEKKTAQSIAYRQGAELTATVDDEKEGYVYLALPNQDVEKRYGIIDPENRRGRAFVRGETIAVKILGFDEDDSAMVVCAPRG